VERPDRREALVRALCSRDRLVAVTGAGGAGKSVLARQACATRQVQRAFRDGIAWLETGPGRHPLVLLADLAESLELPDAAADFSTEEQGRDQLIAALRGKRVLIVVDDVCEPGQLDALTGLAPRCSVLFTTRLDKLADAVKAKEVTVGELPADQALKVLGRWADQDPEALPYGARDLCAQAGNLALGVALAGAMAAQGKPIANLLASLKQPPDREGDRDPAPTDEAEDQETASAAEAVAQGPAPSDEAEDHEPAPAGQAEDQEPGEHPALALPGPGEVPEPAQATLLNVIRVSIAELPEADQERYAQLAVFGRYGPFSRDAARALWPAELPDAEVADLLESLTGRNLLMTAGEGWYTAHDLQYEALERRLGAAGLAAAHARLLEGYRLRYPGGWAESAGDPYLARALAGHLHNAQLGDELRAVLTDTAWIQARLTHGQVPGLITDYGYAGDPLTRQILRALRGSAPILVADPDQVRSQLAVHLTGQFDQRTTGAVDREEPTPADADPAAPAEAEPDAATTEHEPAPTVEAEPAAHADAEPVAEHELASPAEAEPAALTAAEPPVAPADHEPASTDDHEPASSEPREPVAAADYTGWVFSVAITPDGARAVSGGDDGAVRVWDLAAGREQATLTGHTRPVWSVAITPDGTRAVSGSSDGTVRVWDLAAGREQATLTGHTRPVWSVAITPDGTRAVSGGDDGTVRVWDLAAGREQAALTGRDRPVFSVAITPDGARAVSGAGNDLQVWDLSAAKARATLTGHTGEVWSVAITPDGTCAVSGSSDGSIRVWGLRGRRARASTLVSDTGQVFAVAITQDKTVAVSGSEDGSVQVWDVSSRTEVARWTGRQPIIGCILLTGRPIRVGVGQRKGAPFLLELRAPGSETNNQREEKLQSGPATAAAYVTG
jgi:NB-ARC domain/WD domain, G-beta repeat/APAF-1 helical domain